MTASASTSASTNNSNNSNMTSAAGIYDDDLHIAHAVLLKSQQQFIIRTTFSWLPVLSLGRHLLTLPLFCTIILLQLAILAVIKNGLVQTSCRRMAKTKPTSLDGRSQKLSKPAWKPKDPAGPNLKPASPPKTNPWNRNPIPAGSDHKDSSTKTQPLADEEFPELGTSGVAADTAASETAETRASPPCDVSKSSCSTNEETQSEESISGVSRISTPTRLILEEEADQAAKILWRHPFGSNVYLYVEKSVFQLHRDILTRRSGWFRDRLPPPNQDGSPIEIHLPHAIGAVQPCLFFMYTKNLDICERDLSQPLNFIHIPRCVLAYCAAVNFQIPAMASRILSILQDTTKDVSKYLNAYYIYKEMDYKTSRSIATCFINSIDILYSEPLFELMKPMRHALAGLLDALLPSLLRQPYFPEILCMPSWKRWSAAIAADQVEYRTALGHYRPSTESILPSELELGALFDRVLGQYGLCQKNKASARTCYPEEHARRGTPDSLDGQDRASTGQCWKKREASIKEYSEEESTLVYQAPSVAGSTGSETGTWNSFGTDGAEADVAEAEAEAERPPTPSPRACHGRCMRSKSNAAAAGGQGMGGRHSVKKRLYLSPPDPDIVTRQTHVTRYIPESPSPSPPAVEYITLPPRPPPAIIQLPPPPPPTLPPAPMPPPPPFPAPVYSLPPLRRPSPEPEFIEVIAVSEDEKDDKKKKKKKNKDKHHHRSKSRSSVSSPSRSRSRSHHRHRDDDELSRYHDRDRDRDVEESRDREVYIERERYVPYPVPVPMEPQYKTYRYVDAPRSPARRRASSPSPPRYIEEDRERDYIRIKDREYRYD